MLSTLHSAKGQEWNAVHILNVVDGCMPADMATGHAAEIEEERRLLYVGMTRARDSLSLWVPQRFHVTQQRALGGRHLYALRSRFVPEALLPHFELQDPSATRSGPDRAGADKPDAAPVIHLSDLLRRSWAAQAGNETQTAGPDRGQNPD